MSRADIIIKEYQDYSLEKNLGNVSKDIIRHGVFWGETSR